MEITFGGNSFFTNKKSALAAARNLATATIYRFTGKVVNSHKVRKNDSLNDEKGQNIYLVMGLGEGCSEKNLGVVEHALCSEVVARRDNFKWLD